MEFKHLRLVLFLLLAVVSAWPVSAKELDSKLEATARKLTEAAAARKMSTPTLAVFPFQADEKLSKKKVNFAVSEILTKNFLKLGKFTVIERAQLEEVMKEQKLGASGAVDSKTAAEIGKLAGAKLLVLGNVIQMGNSYQLTAKLVDAQTGEMIASEITEVPVTTFDEDANRYLVLVPEYETIGIYGLGAHFCFTTVKKLPPVAVGGDTIIPGNKGPGLGFAGIGVRYSPSPKWMFDAAYFKNVISRPGHLYSVAPLRQGAQPDFSGDVYRLAVDRVGNISPKFKTHFGAGGMAMFLLTRAVTEGVGDPLKWNEGKYITPFVRMGVEWKPKARIGWALFGQYNVLKKDYKIYADCYGSNPSSWAKVFVSEYTFPQIILETTFSFYF